MRVVPALVIATLFTSPVIAGEAVQQSDGSTVWEAGLDGVSFEFNPDHTVHRVYSMVVEPVDFPDRRGIQKAQTVAEEKAKAAIVRFMQQDVTSARVTGEMEDDMQKAQRLQQNGTNSLTKDTQRTMAQRAGEIITSFASGKLPGVIVLERGYDAKNEEAWTKVGISQNTVATSDALRGLTTSPPSSSSSSSSSSTPNPTQITRPGSEVKKLDKDW